VETFAPDGLAAFVTEEVLRCRKFNFLCPNKGVITRGSKSHAIFIPAVPEAAHNITVFFAYSLYVQVSITGQREKF
jgi:hypothetical protein